MIIVDISALVAIAFAEPERETFVGVIETSGGTELRRCFFSYALAKVRGLPFLFKGDDSAQTDIASALVAQQ